MPAVAASRCQKCLDAVAALAVSPAIVEHHALGNGPALCSGLRGAYGTLRGCAWCRAPKVAALSAGLRAGEHVRTGMSQGIVWGFFISNRRPSRLHHHVATRIR